MGGGGGGGGRGEENGRGERKEGWAGDEINASGRRVCCKRENARGHASISAGVGGLERSPRRPGRGAQRPAMGHGGPFRL